MSDDSGQLERVMSPQRSQSSQSHNSVQIKRRWILNLRCISIAFKQKRTALKSVYTFGTFGYATTDGHVKLTFASEVKRKKAIVSTILSNTGKQSIKKLKRVFDKQRVSKRLYTTVCGVGPFLVRTLYTNRIDFVTFNF